MLPLAFCLSRIYTKYTQWKMNKWDWWLCFAFFIRSVPPLSFCPVMSMDELLSATFLTPFILCFYCAFSFCPFSGPSGLKPQFHRSACGGCSVYLVFMCLSSALSEKWSSESSIQQLLWAAYILHYIVYIIYGQKYSCWILSLHLTVFNCSLSAAGIDQCIFSLLYCLILL